MKEGVPPPSNLTDKEKKHKINIQPTCLFLISLVQNVATSQSAFNNMAIALKQKMKDKGLQVHKNVHIVLTFGRQVSHLIAIG